MKRMQMAMILSIAGLLVGCQNDQKPDVAPPATNSPSEVLPSAPEDNTKSSTTETSDSPAPSTEAENPDQERVVSEIQGLGGEVMRNFSPGNPVYGVRFSSKKVDLAALVSMFKQFSDLQTVGLDGTGLTDASLAELQALGTLKELDLSNNQITDEGLANLKGLTKLESLRISQNKINGAGLSSLQELKNLKKLFLGRNPITDDALAHLQGLEGLEELNLSGCTDVTNASLEHLAKIPNLKELWIPFTRINDQGAADFKQKRPNVTIEN